MLKPAIAMAAIAMAAALIVTCAGVRAAGVTIDQSGQQFSEKSISLKPGQFPDVRE